MKQRLRLLSPSRGSLRLAIILLVVVLVLPVFAPITGPALVANPGTGQKEFRFGWQQSTVYAAGFYWAFWSNSGTCEGENLCLYYATSPDGSSWSGPTNVGIHTNREDFSATTDGSKIYYVRYNETDYFDGTCNHALLFRQGTISGRAITWQAENTVITGVSTLAYINPNLRLDSTGQAWIGYLADDPGGCGGTGTERPDAIHSSGTNYASWSSSTVLSTAHSLNWAVDLTSLGNGVMYFTYWVVSSNANAADLHGKMYNSSFGSDQQISATTDKVDGNAFLYNDGTTIYAVWLDENTQNLKTASTSFTAPATETWNSPVTIKTSECCSTATNYNVVPWSAAYDSATKLQYLFWYNYTNNAIDLYTGLTSTWTGPTTIATTVGATSTSSIVTFQLSAVDASSNQVIGIQFMDGQASGNHALKYFVDTTQSAPANGNPGNPPPPTNPTGPPAPNNFAFNTVTLSTAIGNATLPYQLTQTQALIALIGFPAAVIAAAQPPIGIALPSLAELKRRSKIGLQGYTLYGSTATAVTTVALDYLFHLNLTLPMEIPAYFVAKFLVALGFGAVLAFWRHPSFRSKALATALGFTLFFDVYYGVGVLLLKIPGLSASPNQIIEIAGFGASCLGYTTCDLTTQGILLVAWTFFHGLFFFAGAYVGLVLSRQLSKSPGYS